MCRNRYKSVRRDREMDQRCILVSSQPLARIKYQKNKSLHGRLFCHTAVFLTIQLQNEKFFGLSSP